MASALVLARRAGEIGEVAAAGDRCGGGVSAVNVASLVALLAPPPGGESGGGSSRDGSGGGGGGGGSGGSGGGRGGASAEVVAETERMMAWVADARRAWVASHEGDFPTEASRRNYLKVSARA